MSAAQYLNCMKETKMITSGLNGFHVLPRRRSIVQLSFDTFKLDVTLDVFL